MTMAEELREVSGQGMARILGMDGGRARAILSAGEIPEAYRTEGSEENPGEWRAPLWAIKEWQARRANGTEQQDAAGEAAAS